jgi:hypothetical protein
MTLPETSDSDRLIRVHRALVNGGPGVKVELPPTMSVAYLDQAATLLLLLELAHIADAKVTIG